MKRLAPSGPGDRSDKPRHSIFDTLRKLLKGAFKRRQNIKSNYTHPLEDENGWN